MLIKTGRVCIGSESASLVALNVKVLESAYTRKIRESACSVEFMTGLVQAVRVL